jgi:hypothetical protein
MTESKKILILHTGTHPDSPDPGNLEDLARALMQCDAHVTIRSCDSSYDEILDAVEAADSVVFWS